MFLWSRSFFCEKTTLVGTELRWRAVDWRSWTAMCQSRLTLVHWLTTSLPRFRSLLQSTWLTPVPDTLNLSCGVIGKGSPYSITERRVPELIPVLGSQPAGDVSHKPGSRLPLLSARPAVTLTTLRAATSFAAWSTEARWVWTVCLRLLPDSVATAIWTQVLLRLSPAC